jgi:hypothetical protein
VDQKQEQQSKDKDLPSGDKAIAREGERNREEMDSVPEPGTDPLHEGP